jgi:hypothetical protein
MQFRLTRTILFFALVFTPARWIAGQTTQGNSLEPAKPAVTAPPAESRASRWLDLQAGTLGFRDMNQAAPSGPWIEEVEYQFITRGRLKFDSHGRYGAGFRLSTGNMFRFSWNGTGAADTNFESNVYLKELFFSASPWKGIEFQYGGIGINRGESTEITSYSNNGYLTGERISIRRPDKLFFDEISATGAYLGDIYNPGIFQRMNRLGSMNYHQFMVVKKVHKHASVSADYTSQDGVQTLRQACKFTLPRNPLAESVLFEDYERLDYYPAWGYALTIQKSPTPRLVLSGGVVRIDPNNTLLNADRMGRGSRVYVTANYRLWRDFTAAFYATKAYGDMYNVTKAARYDLILTYDFMKALKRNRLL